ncbi:hypothetical protein [Aquimarina sp. AU474]|uniref:hypothetical protein n=1 Tax=Aquimarina sp. AU474 TaxID=2108529 RepID=UPI000D6855B4|nr:hypothetical protein [Aquimarina sp. AU474]
MKRIKIILVFFLATLFIGCENDDNTGFFYDLVPIESVVLPDEFTRGETYTLSVSYFRPTSCHGFAGFDYNRLNNERTVAVVNVVVNPHQCQDLEQTDLVEETLDFFVGQEDSYIFRFWQGLDELGNNIFLSIEVPVVL